MTDKRPSRTQPTPTSDGTRELLFGGVSMLAVGLLALLLIVTLLGGIDYNGAHSNSGWFALIVGAMCVPFGSMLTLLGLAKWLRNRRP